MGMFDGMLLKTEQPTKVLLKRPDGTPLLDNDKRQAFISVLSTDSKKANQLRQAARDKRLQDEGPRTSAAIEDESNRLLAALTTEWYLVGFDGKPIVGNDGTTPLAFSEDNAYVLYSEPGAAHWTEQVKGAAGNRQNFMPAPATV